MNIFSEIFDYFVWNVSNTAALHHSHKYIQWWRGFKKRIEGGKEKGRRTRESGKRAEGFDEKEEGREEKASKVLEKYKNWYLHEYLHTCISINGKKGGGEITMETRVAFVKQQMVFWVRFMKVFSQKCTHSVIYIFLFSPQKKIISPLMIVISPNLPWFLILYPLFPPPTLLLSPLSKGKWVLALNSIFFKH